MSQLHPADHLECSKPLPWTQQLKIWQASQLTEICPKIQLPRAEKPSLPPAYPPPPAPQECRFGPS